MTWGEKTRRGVLQVPGSRTSSSLEAFGPLQDKVTKPAPPRCIPVPILPHSNARPQCTLTHIFLHPDAHSHFILMHISTSSQQTSPHHPNACSQFIPMHFSTPSQCTSPLHPTPSRCAPSLRARAQPHAAPCAGSPVACWRAEAACQHSMAPGPMCCTLYCGTSKNYFGMCLCGLQQCPSLR